MTDTTVVPFLPVNPEYSSTRNQVRDRTGDTPARARCVTAAFIAAVLCLHAFLRGVKN